MIISLIFTSEAFFFFFFLLYTTFAVSELTFEVFKRSFCPIETRTLKELKVLKKQINRKKTQVYNENKKENNF